MHVIRVRNVAEALPIGLKYLLREGNREPSRDGPVITAPGPVTTHYTHPWECVLLNPIRDANPFFAVAEAMWILAGRRDAAFLNTYIKDFGERYAEKDGFIHGAYGGRLRHWFGYDQLDAVVEKLQANLTTRQAVVQMWDGRVDLQADVKDRPCNMSVVFRNRNGVLDMTVYNRSNDIIMGAYGANAVHFAFLQQYVAGKVGLLAGAYYQVSNDYHAYVRDIAKLSQRAGRDYDHPQHDGTTFLEELRTPYPEGAIPVPLIADPASFDEELGVTIFKIETETYNPPYPFKNTFLDDTVLLMAAAHNEYKKKNLTAAIKLAQLVQDKAWRRASVEWLERRRK